MNIKEKYNQIDLAKRQKLGEVVRFAIVGGIATVLQYVIYLAAMPLLANLIPALGNSDHTLATVATHWLIFSVSSSTSLQAPATPSK